MTGRMLGIVLLTWGCSSLDPGTDTGARLLGAGSGGSGTGGKAGIEEIELPPEWACLKTPQVFADRQPGRVTYVVPIVDFDSQPAPNTPTVVPNLTITVCGSPSCDPPASAPEVVVQNPVPGLPPYVYAIEMPYNFSNGYLRLTAPDYAPMDYVFGGPMKGPPEGGYVVTGLSIPLLKASTRDTIYNDLGLPGPADPKRGVVALRTLSCLRMSTTSQTTQGQRAAGVRVVAHPEAPPAPAVPWTLSFSNRATPNKLVTDGRGVGGYVNVLPGTVDVNGVAPVAGGLPYGETTVAVRAGVITLAELRQGIDRWGQ